MHVTEARMDPNTPTKAKVLFLLCFHPGDLKPSDWWEKAKTVSSDFPPYFLISLSSTFLLTLLSPLTRLPLVPFLSSFFRPLHFQLFSPSNYTFSFVSFAPPSSFYWPGRTYDTMHGCPVNERKGNKVKKKEKQKGWEKWKMVQFESEIDQNRSNLNSDIQYANWTYKIFMSHIWGVTRLQTQQHHRPSLIPPTLWWELVPFIVREHMGCHLI